MLANCSSLFPTCTTDDVPVEVTSVRAILLLVLPVALSVLVVVIVAVVVPSPLLPLLLLYRGYDRHPWYSGWWSRSGGWPAVALVDEAEGDPVVGELAGLHLQAAGVAVHIPIAAAHRGVDQGATSLAAWKRRT